MKTKKTAARNEIIKNGQDKWVLSIMQDKEGEIWTGTYGAGLFRHNPKTNATEVLFDYDQSVATILSIYQSKSGEIWIGTFGGGVIRYNKQTKEFKIYNSDNGLPNNVVYSVFEDNLHNIWLGTEGGGACYKNINDFDNDKSHSLISRKRKRKLHQL